MVTKAERDAMIAANAKERADAVSLIESIDATGALIAKIVADVPASPPPPPPTSARILWRDDIQTSTNFTREMFATAQMGTVIRQANTGTDTFGASMSRVRDPLDPTKWALRFYLAANAAGQWGRAQLSISSAALGLEAFAQQLATKGEVWVSQDILLPEALTATGATAWLSMQDFHVHTNSNVNRLDTWPGFFMGAQLSNNCPAGQMISRHTSTVAPYPPVFSQPTPLFPVGRWETLTTRYPWPAQGVSRNVEYYFGRTKVAEAPIVARPNGQATLEFMIKLYGEGPWSQLPIVNYRRNIIVADGLL